MMVSQKFFNWTTAWPPARADAHVCQRVQPDSKKLHMRDVRIFRNEAYQGDWRWNTTQQMDFLQSRH